MTQLIPIDLTVNGRPRAVEVAAHHTLLEVLRDDLDLTGTKECCLVGECGACTVRLDGRLSPLQQAFLDHGAAQCGFCIPGQLIAGVALLAATPHPTRTEVEAGLAGNLCRCAGYEQIIEAVLAAAEGDGR